MTSGTTGRHHGMLHSGGRYAVNDRESAVECIEENMILRRICPSGSAPCSLARYNGVTDAPRDLIAATGAELVEMPRHGTDTFCCGAVGGRIRSAESESVAKSSR